MKLAMRVRRLQRVRSPGRFHDVQRELQYRIMELTDNGEEVIQFFLNTMRDDKVHLKYRMAAAEWLANRMWGKEPVEMHMTEGGIMETLIQATDEELRRLIAEEDPAFERLFVPDQTTTAE